jgi:hypothetical protein
LSHDYDSYTSALYEAILPHSKFAVACGSDDPRNNIPKEDLMLASNLLRVSVVLIVIGMVLGIAMGIAQDFRLAPAHAHLNLVGYVALFLAGLYYQAVPKAAASALATAWIAVVGAVVFPLGIAAVLLGGPSYEVCAVIGALIALAGMVLFAIVVFRNGAPARA